MEKHFWFGSALLVALLLLALGISLFMDWVHTPAVQALEEASQAAARDDLPLAQALVAHAQSRWQRFRNLSAAVADHTPIEDADSLFSELACYIQTGESVQLSAGCARLSQLIEAIIQAHRPNWWNLL